MNNVRDLAVPSPARGLLFYLRTYALILGVCVLNRLFPSPLLFVFSLFFIGARQHSLYALNHEASHGNLFKGKAPNKYCATLLSNLVFFHHPEAYSFVQWRRVHMLHHAFLFTGKDPNYVGRELAGDTTKEYGRWKLLLTAAKAAPLSMRNLFLGRQDYVPPEGAKAPFVKNGRGHLGTLALPFKDDPEMERERRLKLVFFAAASVLVTLLHAWREFALLWLLPMYTVYPAILTLMDLTEHDWTDTSGNVRANTRSTKPGFLARWLISDLNRSLHREHHLYPTIPFFRLPRLSRDLVADGVLDEPRRSFLPAR